MMELNLVHADNVALDQSQLNTFIDQIKDRKQGFYECIDDEKVVGDIRAYVQGKTSVKDVVVLGIGGSALGPRAIGDALRPFFAHNKPHLHVIDNVDPDLIAELEDHIELQTTLFIVITKSGGTAETLSQYFYFREKIDSARLDPKEHFVFITDPHVGLLRKIYQEEGIPTFDVPPNVGGRFSVLTAVGLLPAALMGMDIEAMLAGARTMRDQFLHSKLERNTPYHLASIVFDQYKKGRSNVVFMPYKAHLRTVGDWYAQLLAESTGKLNANGENVGMTPIVATGVTDQHSQLQLYAQGPDDKQFIFLTKTREKEDQIIPAPTDNEKTKMLHGISFGALLQTEYQGTAASLDELGRGSVTLEIDQINEETLGELFMLFQGMTAFLGEFLEIDAFDQPGVERSKVLTREYLAKSSN